MSKIKEILSLIAFWLQRILDLIFKIINKSLEKHEN